MTAGMPAGAASNGHSGTGTPRASEGQKMASSGNEDLFKTGGVMHVDNKLSTGNEDLFKSGFAKSAEDDAVKSVQLTAPEKRSSKKSSLQSQHKSKKASEVGEGVT